MIPASASWVTASATLVREGKRQLAQIAETLRTVTAKIPGEIDRVLRIDGHTDRRPINTGQFPSNRELSAARPLSIVDYLVEQGIPPRRLAAAGFGEYQPVDTANALEAYAQPPDRDQADPALNRAAGIRRRVCRMPAQRAEVPGSRGARVFPVDVPRGRSTARPA
jgi:outer membrane protein OmpA-like peptidoglycan-associated protein